MMVRSPRLATRIGLLILVALLGRTAVAAPAGAHERARKRFDEGLALADRGELPAALRAFEDAYAIEPNPAVLYNIAQAYGALDRPQQALLALRRYRDEAAAQLDPARGQAIDEQIRILRERLALSESAKDLEPPPEPATGVLDLRCPTAGTRVFVDGRPLGEGPFEERLTLAEGPHEVRFEHQARPVEVRSVMIKRAETVAETCSLALVAPPAAAPVVVAPPPPPPPSASRGPVLMLAGGGVLVGGALALHFWNDSRYQRWDLDVTRLEMAPEVTSLMESDARDQEVASLEDRRRSIQRTDKVVWGLAAAGGLLVAAGAAWWWARYHGSP